MKVRVIVEDQILDVSCGDGKQSFQWLAAVVQDRIKFLKKGRSLEVSFLVTEMRNKELQLLNPKDKIFEHADTVGFIVTATVKTAFPVDDWENPEMNPWMQAAFVRSSSGQHWTQEVEAWRQSLKELKLSQVGKDLDYDTALMAQKIFPQASKLIEIGFEFSENDLSKLFNLDWVGLSFSWLQKQSEDIAKLGRLLQARYSLICNIFAHYAGIGKVGQRFGMTIEELGHALHFMKSINWRGDEDFVDNAYKATNLSNLQSKELTVPAKKDFWPLITRSHFVSILVFVASKHFDGIDILHAVEQFLDGPVKSLWESLSGKYLSYTCPEVILRQTLSENFQLMKNFFHQRASLDTKYGPRLSASDFLNIMEETTLIDNESEDTCLACFLQAQLNPPIQLELEYLVFAEFIEAVSRVALRSIENIKGFTDAKRIRMALNMLIELPVKVSGKGYK